MSGHSKWANTKHRKNNQDQKKSKIFTKIIKNIVTAKKLKGNDINTNSNLRAVINNALSNNMKRDIINRAMDRNVLKKDNNVFNKTYEVYGPGGIGIIIECCTNNINRTISEVRNILIKNGGNLSIKGSVEFLFKKQGIIKFLSNIHEDVLLEIALKIEADNLIQEENNHNIIFIKWEKLNIAKKILKKFNVTILSSTITKIPLNKIEISKESEAKLSNLIKMLKCSSDVKNIYHNSKLNYM